MCLSCIFYTICVKIWDPIDLVVVREDVTIIFSLLEWELLGVFFICDDPPSVACGGRIGYMWANT
jgi:hypothetical protein